MKTFKDITFKQSRLGKGNIQGDPKGWQSREDINELIKLLS